MLRSAVFAGALACVAIVSPRAETLTFAVGEWSPFISETVVGYGPHAEKVTDVFESAGYTVEFEFMGWKRAYELSKRGDYVGSFSWYPSEERRREMLFPDAPIYQSEQTVFYNANAYPNGLDIPDIETIKAMDLQTVAVGGYWIEGALEAAGLNPHVVSEASSAWKMLSIGRVDIHVEDPTVAAAEQAEILGADESAAIRKAGVLKTDDMFVLFSRAHPKAPELVEIWNAHHAAGGS